MTEEIILGEMECARTGRISKVSLWENYGVVMPATATTNGSPWLSAYVVAARLFRGYIQWRPRASVPAAQTHSATAFFLAVRYYLTEFARCEAAGEEWPQQPWS